MAEDAEALPGTAEVARERDDTGKFVKGRGHRARSHQAGAEDVPRIAELTKKLRETEAERDALKAAPAVQSASPAHTTQAVQPARPAPPAAIKAERPKLDAYDNYEAFSEALIDWKVAEARASERAENQRVADAQRLATSWRERVISAQTQYPDFDAIALQAPTEIPQGSLVDAWILEHKSGAHVLYHLQKHPEELRGILGLSVFDQVDALSQLALRLSTPTRAAAATTGAAPTTPLQSVPRPPTPVRTGPMRAADEPPGDEATLAEHERYYYRNGRRR